MNIKEFLEQISDEQGPLQTSAADLMERMSPKDFAELLGDIVTMKLLEDALDGWIEKVSSIKETSKDRHPVTLEELDLIN